MESTGVAAPGLARAGAPAVENARQALTNLKFSSQNVADTYALLSNLRAYLAIADTVPKPYPMPAEAARQFTDLRQAAERIEAHFRVLLVAKRLELQSLWTDPKADPNAILAKEKELRNLKDQMMDKVVQMKLEARKFLTPEQIANWKPGC